MRCIDVSYFFVIDDDEFVKVGYKKLSNVDNWNVEHDNKIAEKLRKELAELHKLDISKIVRISAEDYEKSEECDNESEVIEEDENGEIDSEIYEIYEEDNDPSNIIVSIELDNGMELQVDTGTDDMKEAVRRVNEEDYSEFSVISATMFGVNVDVPRDFLQDRKEGE
ncbi:hypothetical protein [Peptoanaerobacter stomatis]|uniref:hypothetical protein n=1 Tax=Peptoanaerobacter stomatis TaxID=796937 RepID=UPI003F9F0D06